MGNRVTRAATHLPKDAVYARMQREQRPWRRKLWEIIYQALTAPRKAEDIAKTVGVSVSSVHRVIAAYQREGVAALETPGKGGRRRQYLTLEQEHAFLQPFVTRAAQGETVTVAEIHHAFEEQVRHLVDDSTIYRLLNRHGWRQHSTGVKTHSGSVSSPENPPTQEDRIARRERRKQSFSPKMARGRSSRCYPSDLTDREWAILEPLIPPAKEGGHPRTTDMRDVLNALFYVDRTGCECASVASRFPSVVHRLELFSHLARSSSTWQRMNATLREHVRVKQGREPTPSAAIIDSQSVKTSQKGGIAATTVARKWKGANGMCSSTPRV